MHRPLLAVALSALSVLAIGCGGGGASGGAAEPAFEAARFIPEMDLGYFPVEMGRTWTYEGDEDGQAVLEEVRTLDTRRTILGVRCTGIEESFYVGGVLSDRSVEWYAEDVDGNVWRFGEEASSFVDGVEFPSPDAWIASARGIRPWLALPAVPVVGARFSGTRPDGIDTYVVTAVDRTVTTPAGVFTGCTEFVENPDDPEDTDIILFAPRVGRIAETSTRGRATLVGFTPRP